MKIKLFILSIFSLFAFTSSQIAFDIPENWPTPHYDFSKNPLDKNKIELGRALFYEPMLSHNGIVSCASCHSPFSSFTHIKAFCQAKLIRAGEFLVPMLSLIPWLNE